jgi:hypothetical protein
MDRYLIGPHLPGLEGMDRCKRQRSHPRSNELRLAAVVVELHCARGTVLAPQYTGAHREGHFRADLVGVRHLHEEFVVSKFVP